MKVRKLEVIKLETGYSIYINLDTERGDVYDLRVETSEGEIVKWSCNCPFGSAYRFSKQNEETGKECRHNIYVKSVLKFLGYLK